MTFKHIIPGLCFLLVLFISCSRELLNPSFEKNGLTIVFDKDNWSNYYVGKQIEDKAHYTQIIFLSHSSKNYINITQAKNLDLYENFEKGKRNYCPPSFLQSFPDYFRKIPTTTEVLNDTTYLIGSFWFEDSGDIDGGILYPFEGSFGWHFTILNPNTITFIDIWSIKGNAIFLDTLLNRSEEIRNEITISINDRNL